MKTLEPGITRSVTPRIDHNSGRFRGRVTGPPRPSPGNRQEACRLILLDHNIPQSEVQLLRRWRIHCRQVGYEVGRPEWDDFQEIFRYLQRARRITFLQGTSDFFDAASVIRTTVSSSSPDHPLKAPFGFVGSSDILNFASRHCVIAELSSSPLPL